MILIMFVKDVYSVLRTILNGGNMMAFLESLIIMLPVVVIGLSFHEAAHGYMAYKMGDPTAKNMGRLTLNPLKHLDPIGFAAMLLVGFGWAKPVQFNPYNFKDYKKGTILTAIAGPLANLLLAVCALVLYTVTICILSATSSLALLVTNDVMRILTDMLFYLYLANIVLMLFNLIPVPPLDGSKVLFSVLPSKSYRFVLNYERYGMYILLVLLWFNILDAPLDAALEFFVDIFNNAIKGITSLFGLSLYYYV